MSTDNRDRKIAAGRLARQALVTGFVLGLLMVASPLRVAAEEGCGMESAIAHFEGGELEESAQCFKDIVEEDADNHQAHYYLGRIALTEGDLDGSIASLKTAVDLKRDLSDSNYWLARAFLEKLKQASFFEKGILSGRVQDHLKRAIELDPSNVEARVYLASYYLNAPSIGGGSTKKAKQQVAIITQQSPQHGHSLMAQIYIKEGQLDLAEAELEAYLEINPGDTDTLYQVGMLYQKIEKFDAAFDAFEQAFEVDPEALASLYQIGRTAVFSSERIDRGIECLTEYLGRDLHPGVPGKDAAHWRLGMLYEKSADLNKAVGEYEAAIALSPGEQSYRDSLDAARRIARK